MLFERDYSFKGAHADKVKLLVDGKFDKEHTLFERNMDVYLLAPIIGFLKNRKSPIDKSTSTTTNILADVMNRNNKALLFNYRLIMLLDKEYEPDQTERINKAFKYYLDDQKTKADIEHYEEYVRGGVDYLYEKLWEDSVQPDDYIKNLHELVEDFYESYGDLSKDIEDLCRFARG